VAEATQRPAVPTTHASEAEHRRLLAQRANASLPHDGTGPMTAPLRLQQVAVAGLPDASLWTGALVYVSDEAGGAVPAFSDGTSWRRVTDRAVVS
jgi:hypothetical protein